MRTYLALILAAAVVASAAASGYGFLWSAQQARSSAISSMSFTAAQAATKISSALETARTTVNGLAAQPGLGEVFVDAEGCQLNATGDDAFASVRIDIVSRAGEVVCSSDPSAVDGRRPHAGSAWLATTLASPRTRTAWDVVDAVNNEPAIVVSAPITSAGSSAGVLAVVLHMDGVGSTLAKQLGGAEDASIVVVGATDHKVLSSSVGAMAGDPFGDGAASGEWVGADGNERVFGSADVADSDWRVYAGVDRSDVLADSRGTLMREGLIGLLAMVILACGLWVLSRRVSQPLRELTRAVSALTHSGEPVTVPEQGAAEIASLAHEFNTMIQVNAGHVAHLAHLANHDALTGLLNNRLLREQIALARQAPDGVEVSLLLLGLNRFKVVNDALGYEAGDRILCQVANRLLSLVPDEDIVARFGGDEFAVLSTGRTPEEAVAFATELRACLAEAFLAPDDEVVLQVSVGVTTATARSVDCEQMVREAVAALHHARAADQSVSVYDETLQVRASYQIEMERNLRRALQNDELVVHYQPLTDVAMGDKIVGVEALVRWAHPERGMVPPLEFISVAETSGQIKEIGALVLKRSCRQAAEWSAAGHPVRMSVNVAARQFQDGDFPRIVAETLKDTGLPADQLCLEITESAVMRSDSQMAEGLIRLRRLGVHLAIDDFGTGYSSLSYLHRLPVDEIKIDRSFISRMGIDPRVRHLVEAILTMAKALELTVVAEGVETAEQLDYLNRHGCDIAQGYLFSPPRPAPEILVLLTTDRQQREAVR